MKYIINSKNIITHYHCMASPLEICAVNLSYQIGMGQLNVEVDLRMADCYSSAGLHQLMPQGSKERVTQWDINDLRAVVVCKR